MRSLLFIFLLSVLVLPLYSARDTIYEKKIVSAVKVDVSPELDGWINEEIWNDASWAGDFQMYDPYDDRPASQQTRFKLVFDEENLYIAIRCFDSAPDSITRRLTRRDDVDGDIVGFMIDSYHDLQTSSAFCVSAAGSKFDAYESEDGDNRDETWNSLWIARTQIDDKGWTVEIKVPFSQLRFDKGGDGIWGFQLFRQVYRSDESSFWQPKSKEASGWTRHFGELHGLQGITPKKQAEITPYAVMGSEWFEKEEKNPFRADGYKRILKAGVDAKIGITNNFTVDLTINPDFGQVEADPSQVNLTAYETFFEEQRPFFIEGKNIFDYNLAVYNHGNIFYSRRIGRRPHHYPSLEEGEYSTQSEFTNIIGAAKITGKTKNGLSVGVMESITSCELAEIDFAGARRQQTVEPMTNYFVSRVSKEFDKGNTIIGGILTSTYRFNDEEHLDYLHSSALTGGLDFKQYFDDRSYAIGMTAYGSQVKGSEKALIRTQLSSVHYFQRPNTDYIALDSTRTSLSGYGASLEAGKESGNLRFKAFVNLNSPGLELNDLGFMTETDEIVQIFWVGYRFTEPFSIFRFLSLNINQYNFWNFGGIHQGAGANINGQAQFTNLSQGGFYLDLQSEVFSNSALRGGPLLRLPGKFGSSVLLSTNTTKKLVGSAELKYESGFENSGQNYGASLELEYKPISNLNLSLEPGFEINQEEWQWVTHRNPGTSDRFIGGSIDQKTLSMSFRANLSLTPELTLQFWGQPFIGTGNYSDFKYVSNPLAEDFTDRFHIYRQGEILFFPYEDEYQVRETGSELNYSFGNPDFNIKEFISNLVFRWEYRPGSFIYLVWSQSRSGYDPRGLFHLKNDFVDIWNIHPGNAVLLKVSYRIGR